MTQYQLLRPLTREERVALKDSIKRNGVKVPIEYDESGNVLDGHHRLEICAELGITDFPHVSRIGMNEEEKIEHIIALNSARRHLTLEDMMAARKERIVRVEQAREQGKSLRAIAEEEGVSLAQVRRDVTGVPPGTPVTGKDGKQYPAKKQVSLYNATAPTLAKAREIVESKRG